MRFLGSILVLFAGVGVEGLALMGLIDAHVGIPDVEPQVADMSEDVAFPVLGAGSANMAAETEEGGGRFAPRPAVHRQAPQ